MTATHLALCRAADRQRRHLLLAGMGSMLAPPAIGNQATSLPPADRTNTLLVGPGRSFSRIGDAIRAARPGNTILVDAGSYPGDTATVDKDGLSLRAIGGRVDIAAAGRAVEGKAIWVVRAHRISIEGFDFRDTVVPDRNGAGIRFERGSLLLRDCGFFHNQTGLLSGNDGLAVLEIENCEFGWNGYGDGQSHQLYAGKIARLTVSGSYFHHANEGQLIKSRAAESLILYNRLSDEIGGEASYELEFPSGGRALAVGNLIQQSSTTRNSTMVSFGVEGYAWPVNELRLSHNTLIDKRPANGIYLFVKPGPSQAWAVNNLLVGGAARMTSANLVAAGNVRVDWDQLARPTREDYRLRAGARAVGQAIAAASLPDASMVPTREYQHPRNSRALIQPARHPGALQELAPV